MRDADQSGTRRRERSLRQLARALLVLLFMLGCVPGHADEPALRPQVRVKPTEDGATVMLVWPGPTAGRISIAGSKAELRFSRPLGTALSELVRALEPWVLQLTPGGQTGHVTMQLLPETAVELRELHARLHVLVLSRRNPPPSAGDEAATATASADPIPKAGLRVEHHAGFVRLVLETKGKPAHEVRGNMLVLRLGARLPQDAATRLAPLAPLATVVSHAGELRLQLASGVRPKIMELPSGRLVVDLHPALAVATARRAGASAKAAAIEPAAGPDEPHEPPRPMPRPVLATESPTQPEASAERSRAEAVPVTVPSLLPRQEERPLLLPLPRAALAPAQNAVPGAQPLQHTLLRFAVPAGDPAPAAAFARAGILTVVLGTPSVEGPDIPSQGDAQDGAAHASLLSVERGTKASIFRFALVGDPDIVVNRRDDGWEVGLVPAGGSSAPPPALPVEVRPGPEPGLLLRDAEVWLEIADPASGERLGVALSRHPGNRLAAPMSLVDMELLPSSQGFAWRALSQGIVAEQAASGIRLTRDGGLRIAAGADPAPQPDTANEQIDPALPAQATAVVKPQVVEELLTEGSMAPDLDLGTGPEVQPPAIDARPTTASTAPALPKEPLGLARFGPTTVAERNAARRELQRRMASLSGIDAVLARQELALLHLADRAGAEAAAMLALTDAEPDRAVLPPSVADRRVALEGAAAALRRHQDRALSLLLSETFDGDAEIALWRSLAAAQAGRWDTAHEAWRAGEEVLKSYPRPLRMLLALNGAAVELAMAAPDRALAILGKARELEPDEPDLATLRLLEGQALVYLNKPQPAERAFRQALAASPVATRVAAAYALTMLGHETGNLSDAETLAELQAQRRLWRGMPDETAMLRRLAALLAETGDVMGALATLQHASGRARDEATRKTLTAVTRDILLERLGQLSNSQVDPVEALALYRAFADVLAAEPAAVALRPLLAIEAARLGLFDTAVSLLEPAPEGTMLPTDTAAARAEVAMLKAEAETAEAALALLSQDADAAADTRMREQAVLVRAQADLEAGNPAAALQRLGDGDEEQLNPLRARAAWQGRDWVQVAQLAEREVKALPESGPLDPNAEQALLRLALARAHGGDYATARALAERYGARLPTGATPALLQALGTLADDSAVSPAATTARAVADRLRQAMAAVRALGGTDGEPRSEAQADTES